MTALIVDDEPLACKRIEKLLKNDSDINIIASCHNGRDAVSSIKKQHPEIIFLDIQMPEISGFEVLKQAKEDGYSPVVIFITAYDEFALKAFEVHAQDYVLKPFEAKRFNETLHRAKRQVEQNGYQTVQTKLDALIEDVSNAREYLSRLMIKSSGRYTFLKVFDIDWFESAGNYVQIHSGEKIHMIRETMVNLESRLDPDLFFRIHRSYIVNVEKVKQIEQWFHGDYIVILQDGKKLTMSRNYKDLLQKF